MLPDIVVMGVLDGVDLRFLDGDEERRFVVLIHQVEVHFALDKQRSQLASILDIVLEVGEDDMKQIRVVGVQDGRIGPVVSNKLDRQLELILEDSPVDYWMLMAASGGLAALALLLRNERASVFILIASFSTAVIIDVHKRLALLIPRREKQSHHLLPLLVLQFRLVLILVLREEVSRRLRKILLLYLLQIASNTAERISFWPAAALFKLFERSHIHD